MTSSIPDFHTRNFKLGAMSFPEKVIYWVIVLTPLWWLLGIQTLFYPAVVVGFLGVNFDIDKLTRRSIPACIWAWLGMALVMVWTATFGLNDVGFALQKIAATFVTFFKSYCLIFAALLLPFWHAIRVKVVTRAVAWMATGYLVTIAIEMLMLVVGLGKEPFLPPLARLIPGGALSLQVTFADLQPFFGIPLPRTVLYTPDPPIVGVCSILSFFICLGEENRRLRQIS
ncbi:MAG: O-antigen ligase domain-containing protein, partial [Moorea sp. SIO3B2]|nr:O-antigen ligase domain-containing protein [Moorena sp. SIO3B2]